MRKMQSLRKASIILHVEKQDILKKGLSGKHSIKDMATAL